MHSSIKIRHPNLIFVGELFRDCPRQFRISFGNEAEVFKNPRLKGIRGSCVLKHIGELPGSHLGRVASHDSCFDGKTDGTLFRPEREKSSC